MHRIAGAITGYGIIPPCRDGYKIGPLFADNAEIATRLFDALGSHSAGNPVFLDSPEPNSAAIDLCSRQGLEPIFKTARIWRSTERSELPASNSDRLVSGSGLGPGPLVL